MQQIAASDQFAFDCQTEKKKNKRELERESRCCQNIAKERERLMKEERKIQAEFFEQIRRVDELQTKAKAAVEEVKRGRQGEARLKAEKEAKACRKG